MSTMGTYKGWSIKQRNAEGDIIIANGDLRKMLVYEKNPQLRKDSGWYILQTWDTRDMHLLMHPMSGFSNTLWVSTEGANALGLGLGASNPAGGTRRYQVLAVGTVPDGVDYAGPAPVCSDALRAYGKDADLTICTRKEGHPGEHAGGPIHRLDGAHYVVWSEHSSNPAGGPHYRGVWEVPEYLRSSWRLAGRPSRKQQPGMWGWTSLSSQEYNALTFAPEEEWRVFPRGSNPAGGNPHPWTPDQESRVKAIWQRTLSFVEDVANAEREAAKSIILDAEPLSKEIGVPAETIKTIVRHIFKGAI